MNPQIESYKVTLPGKVLYPENAEFSVKKITPFEQKKFYSDMMAAETELEKRQVVYDLLKRLVVCENYNFENIYSPDFQYLLYQIRAITYKLFPIKLYHQCDECGERVSQELDISKLDIEVLEKEKVVTEIELENFGKVPFRYKQIKDDLVIEHWLKNMDIKEDDWMMQFLTLDMLSIDQWKPIEETWGMVVDGAITVQDTMKIEQVISESLWGVKEELSFKCPKCGKEVVVPYSLDATDFFSSNNS